MLFHFDFISTGTVTITRKLKTCPEHPNQTVVFDTSIYTVVSEVSTLFEGNHK